MIESIINFLNINLIFIDDVMQFRMFHAIIMAVCAYCIYDEIKKPKEIKS